MKLMICGGGTAGHVFPGIALAEVIEEKVPDIEIIFVGTERGLEKDIVPAAGYKIELLSSKPFERKISLKTLDFFIATLKSLYESFQLVRKIKPDVVLGTGGFASFAPIAAASIYGIPRILHEQNAVPGLANRLLSKVCPSVAISYPTSKRYFKRKIGIFITGNPVRKSIFSSLSEAEAKSELKMLNIPMILFFGGSRGARKINDAALAMAKLNSKGKFQIVHITGKDDFSRVLKESNGIKNYKVIDFYSDMGILYKAADLLICRAGATTLSEITAIGKPSILVPYPYASNQHQLENAKMLQKNGAAEIILDNELTGDVVFNKIERLFDEKSILENMKTAVLDFGKLDAAESLANVVIAESRMKIE